MRFFGSIEGVMHEVVVDDQGLSNGLYIVTVDGKNYQVDARLMPHDVLSLLIDNRSYDLDLERLGAAGDTLDGRLAVRVRGRVVHLDMLDERRHKMKKAQATRLSENGFVRVTSPMPGKIVRILVEAGESVFEGQGLVVIEAMKMENEIRAPKAGLIKELFAKISESVDGRALLMTIE